MHIDFNQLEPVQRYFAMVQAIIPRPIAWVLSDNGLNPSQIGNPNDNYNLAPFSFFTAICSDPPLLLFSSGKKAVGSEAGQIKDTCRNIQERRRFVVHIASTGQMENMAQTAATLDHGESEVVKAGLETVPFEEFDLPRLSCCKIALGCQLYRIDEIGNSPQSVVYGQIEKMFIDDELIENNESRLVLNPQKLDPLSRLGGNDYSGLGGILQVARPE